MLFGDCISENSTRMGSQGYDKTTFDKLSSGDVLNRTMSVHERSSKLLASDKRRSHDNGIIYGGPDTLHHATSFMTWNRDEAVRLRVEKDGPSAEEPVSIITVFRNVVENYPDHNALATQVDGEWQMITFREYYNCVIMAAKSLIKLGLQHYKGVGIIGFNSPEWFISDLAAIFACGLATGIYTTNSPDACQSIALSAECNVIMVENDHQLQKILSVWPELPSLKAIVQYKGQLKDQRPNVYTWKEFLEVGKAVPDSELEERISVQAPNKCCTLIYTSGTTGSAKGVMLSHDNMIWTAKMAGRTVNWSCGCEVLISYLPLSHVAAQIIDIYVPIIYAATVYFARPDALKGSLGETLREVRPTAFLGVPRVWEKIQEKMMAVGRQNGYVKRWISSWARDIGMRGNLALMDNGVVPYGWSLADYMVFQTVRQALGLDRCTYCVVTAAPVKRDTLEFFLSLNIPLLEIYGLSECSGPHTFTTPWSCRFTSVGKEMLGCSTKLINEDKDLSGELCLYGRNVFMGYLCDEERTRAAFDDDGWLHSGDCGRKDEDGFVFITGRLKEILITAGGENVAPVPIENIVKEELPCISNCVLVGDGRKFLSMLLTLQTEVCRDKNEPTDVLAPCVIQWCQNLGCDVRTVTEFIERKDARVFQAMQEGIDRANRRAVSHAQNIQKWCVLPRDFSLTSGEFGPTMKLKRQVVYETYRQMIDSLYLSTEQNP